MTTSDFDYQRLLRVVDARLEKAKADLLRNTVEELRLKDLISDLDQRVEQGKQSGSNTQLARFLGQDLIWKQWAGRRRKEIHQQLAMNLARKQDLLRVLQVAQGKASALETLAEKDSVVRKRKNQLVDQELQLFQMIVGHYMSKLPDGRFPESRHR